ncbi:MAG TPA: T9SS type A sorting domain-containing protein [Bacteroidia bacterium]|nr:T9SS type A sorting domain-containing protein [Bacteroidia bacterium]HQW00737.1 T9SS type A sorting domain-containing protein [Bacteroidia bacterium]HQW23780.1 T9SS type A sorting domain-containing protein [Bacteroidia bacterium]
MNQVNIFSKRALSLKVNRFLLILAILGLFKGMSANASTGTATGNADWNVGSTWSYSTGLRLPNCADTLVIPSAYTVTVNNQNDYTACSSPMIIYVSGILQFSNGNKLDLPCGSIVYILAGGTVKKSTAGGGSSTLISICGTVEWKAGDGPLSGIDTLGTVGSLPIDLISFEGKQNKRSVQLDWITATEINNSYFTIEKSSNGTEFFEIGKVKGAGNSTYALSYMYVDNSPYTGVSYYRLKQTDYDGRNETFPPVAVKYMKSNANSLEVSLLKNPFSSDLNISINSEERGLVEVKLFDLEGKQVYRSIDKLSENNLVNVHGLSKIISGIYFLQVSTEKECSAMVRVVKMN